ncbi:MAG: hypothetical protein WCO21_02600 [bacterium]
MGKGESMRCFTVENGELKNGIAVDGSSFTGECLCLGSCCEKGHLAVMPFFYPNPPTISEDELGKYFFYDAHPVMPKGSEFFAIAKPNNPIDSRILVRLSHYECRVMSGSSTEVGFGFAVVGEKASDYFYESMRILTPGTVLFLREQCVSSADTLVLVAGTREASFMKLQEFVEKVVEYEDSTDN